MPIEPDAQHVQGFPFTVLLTTMSGLTVSVYIYDDGQQAPGYLDQMIQSLVDHLQEWPGRMPGSDTQGQKYDTLMWPVHPTISDPPAAEPEEQAEQAAPPE